MKNAGKACNNRLYRHIRTFEKIVKNYFVISMKTDDDYFLNQRGAKVYYDITKQPFLQIVEGSQTEMVLSVGMNKSGIPLITILNENNPICYRLPEELSNWAYMVIRIADMGENLFPSQVVFTRKKDRYFADIL